MRSINRFGFRVYFPFKDGALAYHCDECGYKCCKEGYLGATDRELVRIRHSFPLKNVDSFVIGSDAGKNYFEIEFKEPCHFLGAKGRCEVQGKLGYNAKPIICRTFPFNEYLLAGKTLIIRPNMMCPVAWVGDTNPIRPGLRLVRHSDLMADLDHDRSIAYALAAGDTEMGKIVKFELSPEQVDREEEMRDNGTDLLAPLSRIAKLAAGQQVEGLTAY